MQKCIITAETTCDLPQEILKERNFRTIPITVILGVEQKKDGAEIKAEELFDYVKQPIEKQAQRLIKDHFPGALTLVVEKSENTPNYITSNMNTVGIRVPNNDTFAKICQSIDGRVLATTSANLSGEAPALTYEEAIEYIGDKVDLVIEDFGCTAKGLASTVAGFKDGEVVIFRQGEVVI